MDRLGLVSRGWPRLEYGHWDLGALDEAYHPARSEVWDFRSAIDDGGFSDYCHLNTAGRKRFSRSLAEKAESPDTQSRSNN
jgi:hypothetical protein